MIVTLLPYTYVLYNALKLNETCLTAPYFVISSGPGAIKANYVHEMAHQLRNDWYSIKLWSDSLDESVLIPAN